MPIDEDENFRKLEQQRAALKSDKSSSSTSTTTTTTTTKNNASTLAAIAKLEKELNDRACALARSVK